MFNFDMFSQYDVYENGQPLKSADILKFVDY